LEEGEVAKLSRVPSVPYWTVDKISARRPFEPECASHTQPVFSQGRQIVIRWG
jgi:hypothetical protein